MKKNRLLHSIFLFILSCFFVVSSAIAKDIKSSMFIEEETLLEIYPNPFTENTILTYMVDGTEQHVTVNVYDALGNLLQTIVDKNQTVGKYNYKIEIDKPGLYYLQISRAGLVETKRMIKT